MYNLKARPFFKQSEDQVNVNPNNKRYKLLEEKILINEISFFKLPNLSYSCIKTANSSFISF